MVDRIYMAFRLLPGKLDQVELVVQVVPLVILLGLRLRREDLGLLWDVKSLGGLLAGNIGLAELGV